jgi:hypothetical protein
MFTNLTCNFPERTTMRTKFLFFSGLTAVLVAAIMPNLASAAQGNFKNLLLKTGDKVELKMKAGGKKTGIYKYNPVMGDSSKACFDYPNGEKCEKESDVESARLVHN